MTRDEKAQFCIDNAKTTPAFQFYPNDWFGSRHVAAMNSSQRGIHATLIFAAWLEPTCGIPKGEECLTARVLESEIDDCLKVLSWCWFLYENLWFCERVLNERIKQIKLSFLRTEVGSKGGRPIKSRTKNKKPIANQKDSKHKPKKTKSEYEIEKENIKEKEIEIPSHLLEIWPDFLEMRRSIRKPATIRAQKNILSKLYKLNKNAEMQIQILEQSITNDWQDVYELKTESIRKNRYGRHDPSDQELIDQANRIKLS